MDLGAEVWQTGRGVTRRGQSVLQIPGAQSVMDRKAEARLAAVKRWTRSASVQALAEQQLRRKRASGSGL